MELERERQVKVEVDLEESVKTELLACLEANLDVFSWSEKELLAWT